MPSLHDNVFDAALNKISADATAASVGTPEIRKASSGVLVASIPDASGLDASNFTGPASYASGGRQLTAMVSKSSDMKSISVNSAGAAAKLAIKGRTGSASYDAVIADISPAVSLGASDKVNISTFIIALKDPP